MQGAPKRILMAGLYTETNTFSDLLTTAEDFHDLAGDSRDDAALRFPVIQQCLSLWQDQAAAHGYEIVPGPCYAATPGGPVTDAAFAAMRAGILASLRAAPDVAGVILFLHGAMVAENEEDCEGVLLEDMRGIIGNAPIAAVFDLHANITKKMTAGVTILVGYKEWPHVDTVDRAAETFDLLHQTIAGMISPTTSVSDCRTMGKFPTSQPGPMRDFVASMSAAEQAGTALSLTLNHGFPWADVVEGGAKMLAITDNDPAHARALAECFAASFIAIREAVTMAFRDVDLTLAELERSQEYALLIDVGDQVGGGSPGDATHLLRTLIERRPADACYGAIFDERAVASCFSASVSATIGLEFGGRLSKFSGTPLKGAVLIKGLFPAATQMVRPGVEQSLGRLALIEVEGIDVFLAERRFAIMSPTFFERHGVRLDEKRLVGFKGLFNCFSNFEHLGRRFIDLDTPGPCRPNWHALPFKRLKRPIWPLQPE